MGAVITVCSRCGSQLRPCSARCTMGGYVHVRSERHLCNPAMSGLLLRQPERWNVPWLFAHARHVEVVPRENWPPARRKKGKAAG